MTPSLRPAAKIALAFLILAFGTLSAWILRNNDAAQTAITSSKPDTYAERGDGGFLVDVDENVLSTQFVENARRAGNTTSTRNKTSIQSMAATVPSAEPDGFLVSPFEQSPPQPYYGQAYEPPALNAANLLPPDSSNSQSQDDKPQVHEVRRPENAPVSSARLHLLPATAAVEENAEPLPTGTDFQIAEDRPLAENLATSALPPLPDIAPPSPPESAEILTNPRYLLKSLPEVPEESRVPLTELADPVPGLHQMVPLDRVPVSPSPFRRSPVAGEDCVMIPIKSLPPVDEAHSPFNRNKPAESPWTP